MTTQLLNNRYQVIQVLGAGGFGETFLAEDIHMPSRRRCVIKQLKPIANDPKTYQMIQQRFEREAATLEFLGEGSDQIPKLYAYFSENGKFFLVQEWIQGQTLTNLIKTKGSLSETEVSKILLSLLSVLNYVHSKGIIHRDIKPDNIIIRSSNGKPVLIDFGAVKETVRSVMTSSGNLTQSIVIGTPGYMPSEQAVGRPVYATDIYSVGLTAIYLLTGKSPHELETHPQTGEIIWYQHASGVSPQLATILNQAIKPQAGHRYTTASKMLYALQSVTSSPVSTVTSATQATVHLSTAAATYPPSQSSSYQQTPVISTSPTSKNWQKPAWVAGGLIVGSLISAVAIASMSKKPTPEVSVATSEAPASKVETTNLTNPLSVTTSPTSKPKESTNTEVSVSRPAPVVPNSIANNSNPDVQQQLPVDTIPSPSPPTSVTREQQKPVLAPEETLPAETQAPVASTPPPEQEIPIPTPEALTPPPPQELPKQEPSLSQEPPKQEPPPSQEPPKQEPAKPEPPKQEQQKVATANTNSRDVPAFPVGTSEDDVVATLGKPSKRTRGYWNTRAYLYQHDPNRVDLGYLFDRRSRVLRQTEVAFDQSVGLGVMKTTLQGMLGGRASGDIKQGLQQVYERQNREYSFNVGRLKGVIQRNPQDQIYIAVWDADLH
ncbi:MAG: protein kinase [Scytonema sp. PMC 1069.18]|nr:protein kinase [Scytonema sp. PMC 1069.18]MEC4886373.1 protein kinase [Scytonema sp. PMC 1070.18]